MRLLPIGLSLLALRLAIGLLALVLTVLLLRLLTVRLLRLRLFVLLLPRILWLLWVVRRVRHLFPLTMWNVSNSLS